MTGNNGGPCKNTDRELWRSSDDDLMASRLFVTEGGGIGMNVGGFVIVQPIEKWHEYAKATLFKDGRPRKLLP